MSAHKDLLHKAVMTWLTVEGLPDSLENYEAGVDAITQGKPDQ